MMLFTAWVRALIHMLLIGQPMPCEKVWALEQGVEVPAVACGLKGISFEYACTATGCW
jgi:hypothetical protein